MVWEEDDKLIYNFHKIMGHSKNSIISYRSVFDKYRNFHNLSLNELIAEAIFDQENNVPNNRLRVYNRIMTFRNFLVDHYVANTVLSNYSKIKTFYRCNGIHLPYFPNINIGGMKTNNHIRFEDLLSKDEIRNVLDVACDDFRNWILVLLSSGSSRNECYSLTNSMFFKGTFDYHQCDDFKKALKILSKRDDVVCTFDLIRKKTNKPYYAFISPECVNSLAKYKLNQKNFDLDDYLLRHDLSWLSRKCIFFNDYFDLGCAGAYRRFRPHMFRKLFSTYLNQGSLYKKELLYSEMVDNLQGRGKSQTKESYFKNNPDTLKLMYVQVMNNVSLYHYYEWEMEGDEIKIEAFKI